MFCPICGKGNPDGVPFCGGCGHQFGAPAAPAAAPVIPQQPVPQAQPQQYAPQPQQYAAPAPAQPSQFLPFGQYFKSLFIAAIKPVTGASDEAKKYDRIGNSIIISSIVISILTLLEFFSFIIRTAISNAWPRRSSDVAILLLREFGGELLYFSLLTFGCAALFLLAGLCVKGRWSFSRLLAISAMATFTPGLINLFHNIFFSYDVSWLITTLRYFPLNSTFTYAAQIYGFILLYEGITRETKLEGNKKGFVFLLVYLALMFFTHYTSLLMPGLSWYLY